MTIIVAAMWTAAAIIVGVGVLVQWVDGTSARRSYKLLCSHLTPEQRRDLEESQSFYVLGSDLVTYRVRAKFVMGVSSPKRLFCAYPKGVPIYDAMLAQKLLLETNAPQFHRVAISQRKG